MKNINPMGLFGLCCLFIFSCSPSPRPINNEFSYQTKLQAAHHWELLAKDFTKQITATLPQQSLPVLNSSGFGHTMENEAEMPEIQGFLAPPYIYLQTKDASLFGKAFRSYLVTELTRLGYIISYAPGNALTIRWSVNKIHHRADRGASTLTGSKTMAALIGMGVAKAIDTSTDFGTALVAGMALDFLSSGGIGELFVNPNVPHSEILITCSISNNDFLLSRQSGTYYIKDQDNWQYNNIADFEGQKSFLKPKNFTLVDY